MEPLRKNQIYTGVVESYSSEGLGIVRLDGAVVFLPGAVRGETVDLRITKVMKTAAAGEIVRIHSHSPERAKPECPHFGTCGGCDFQHLSYAEELWAKRRRVQDALTRPHSLPKQEPVPSGCGWLYRLLSGSEPSGGAHSLLLDSVGGLRPDRRGCESLDEAVSCFHL